MKTRVRKFSFGFVFLAFSFGLCAMVDPTRPATYFETEKKTLKPVSKKAVTGFRLESILVSKNRKIASVNGRLYQIGDKLGSFTVQEINADHVVLQSLNGIRILHLLTQKVKK